MAAKRCIISNMGKRVLLMAAIALALGAGLWLLFRPSAPTEAAARSLPEELTAYQLTLRLDDENHTLAVTEKVSFRNDTGDTLDSLVLRTWLNAYRTEDTSPAALEELYDACYPAGFSPGGLTLHDVNWNGEAALHAYVNGDQTALRVDIPALAPGETGELMLRCVAQLPLCRHRAGYTEGEYRLGNVIPILSLYENGAWRTEEYAPVGEPFVSACADFSVTLYAPAGYAPACSAPLTQDGDGAWRGEIRAARDVCLCLSDRCLKAEGTAAGVKVTSFAETEAGARRALDDVCKALEVFAALYGPGPYPSLTVWEAEFPFGGMEYPGMILAGKGNYLESRSDTLELTLAHETAHQWFYALVGSDQYFSPWQDEALCEYAMLRYVARRYGPGSYETLRAARVDAPMREDIPGSLTPGSPIDYFANYTDYAAVVYGRGAALLLALDEMLQGGADAFLRDYAEAFAYGYASRDDFEDFLNRRAGMDLSPLLLDYLDTAH